jgi:hypothetical protein
MTEGTEIQVEIKSGTKHECRMLAAWIYGGSTRPDFRECRTSFVDDEPYRLGLPEGGVILGCAIGAAALCRNFDAAYQYYRYLWPAQGGFQLDYFIRLLGISPELVREVNDLHFRKRISIDQIIVALEARAQT